MQLESGQVNCCGWRRPSSSYWWTGYGQLLARPALKLLGKDPGAMLIIAALIEGSFIYLQQLSVCDSPLTSRDRHEIRNWKGIWPP